MPDLTTIAAIALASYNGAKFAAVQYKKLSAKAGEYQGLIDGLKLVVANAKK